MAFCKSDPHNLGMLVAQVIPDERLGSPQEQTNMMKGSEHEQMKHVERF